MLVLAAGENKFLGTMRSSCPLGLSDFLKLAQEFTENFASTPLQFRSGTSVSSKFQTQPSVPRQLRNSAGKRVRVAGSHHPTTTLQRMRYFGIGVRRSYNGSSTGEHAREFGWHYQIGNTCSLRKKVNVGETQELIEQ